MFGLTLAVLSAFLTSWDRALFAPGLLLTGLVLGYRMVGVRLPQGPYLSFTPLVLFTGVFLLGPAPTVVCLALGILITTLLGIYRRPALFNIGLFTAAIFVCSGVFLALGGELPIEEINAPILLRLFIATGAFMITTALIYFTSIVLKTLSGANRFLRNTHWDIVVWLFSFTLFACVLWLRHGYHLSVVESLVLLAPLLLVCYLAARIVENHIVSRQLSHLGSFITRLSAPLHEGEVLRFFFAHFENIIDYDSCAIWVRNVSGEYSLLEYDPVLPKLDPSSVPEIFDSAANTGPSSGRMPSAAEMRWRLFQPLPRRYLIVPMIYGGEVRGMLHLEQQNYHRYTSMDMKLLSLVAENLAVALEHSGVVRELQSTKEYLLNILTSSHIALVVTDRQDRVQIFNRGAAQLSGYREVEIRGKPASRCFHPDDYRKIRRLLFRKGKVEDLETEIIAADGQLVPISFSASVLHDDTGRIVGAIAISYNIAKRKLLQERLLQNEKLVALGRLITGVTHEINNRLQPIIGYTQLLRQESLPAGQAERVLSIENAAEGARSIVQSLLDFSRPANAEFLPGRLNRTVKNVLRLLEIDSDKITVHLQLDPALPTTLYDRHQIEQVLLNLLKNALQALSRRGGQIWIKTCTEGDNKVWVYVRDDGPGISEQIRSRVFDPFFTTKTVGHGVGLGLSLCYGILQAHQGGIQIQSRPDRGTEVGFWLPLKNCPLETAEPAQSAPPAEEFPVPEGGRIFIVDDEETIRTFLYDLLSDTHEVRLFGSGLEVVKAMQSEDFDLCICDLRMPEMDGIEVYHWVCENMPEHSRDFIFITGDTYGPAAQAFLEKVHPKALFKPFKIDQILSLVSEHFQRRPPPVRFPEQLERIS